MIRYRNSHSKMVDPEHEVVLLTTKAMFLNIQLCLLMINAKFIDIYNFCLYLALASQVLALLRLVIFPL